MDLRMERGFFNLSKIAFAFPKQTVGHGGLNLASRVTVG